MFTVSWFQMVGAATEKAMQWRINANVAKTLP